MFLTRPTFMPMTVCFAPVDTASESGVAIADVLDSQESEYERFVRVFAELGGNRTRTAEALGINVKTVSWRANHSNDPRVTAFRLVRDKGAVKDSKLPDLKDLKKALEEHHGNRTRVAAVFNVSESAILKWIKQFSILSKYLDEKGSPGGSLIAGTGKKKMPARIGRPPRIDLLKLEQMLDASGGDRDAAAEFFGVSCLTIDDNVRKRPRLFRFNKKYERFCARVCEIVRLVNRSLDNVKDDDIAEALKLFSGNRKKAAKKLDTHFLNVSLRIWLARSDSPLVRYQTEITV